MQTHTSTTTTSSGLKVKRHVKAGFKPLNHNETLVRDQKPTPGLKAKTHVKAGLSRDVGGDEGICRQGALLYSQA